MKQCLQILGTSDAWLMSHSSQRPSFPVYYIEDCRISILSSSICLYAQLSLITSCCCCCIEFMTLGPSIYKVSIKTGWVGLEKRLVLLTFSTVFMLTWVLYICVGFWLLAHLTRDLSQAEKKITVLTSC